MAEKQHIKHLRTSVAGNEPSADILEYGEIAVNYATDGEKLFIKNSDNEIIPFSADVPVPLDLSTVDIYGTVQTGMTTANCYVVSLAGYYCFPLVYGNAYKNGAVNTAAFTKVTGDYSHDFVNYNGNQITSPFIEEDTGSTASEVILTMADTDNIFSKIKIIKGTPCNYVMFKINDVPATGANGIISVKDASGVIMWSWHIWVWPDSLETVTITNYTGYDYEILPVNLGSKWETSSAEPTKIKNWYWQWGRPNPIPLPRIYNSSTNESKLYGTYTSLTKTTYASDFQTGIKNPNVFYMYNDDGTFNWFSDTSYYNLWDANCTSKGTADNTTVKTIYDPSPVGFKVPNGNTFTGFTTTGGNTDNTSKLNVVGSFSNGWYFKKNSSDSTGVFFHASGWRDYEDGDLRNVGKYGFCWSSAAISQGHAYHLDFYVGGVAPLTFSHRASGLSVRCVRE